jgi:hypothetical protein
MFFCEISPLRANAVDGKVKTFYTELKGSKPSSNLIRLPTAIKFHHRRGRGGPEGGYRYNSTLSLTAALLGGWWLTPRPGRFIPGNDPVPIV